MGQFHSSETEPLQFSKRFLWGSPYNKPAKAASFYSSNWNYVMNRLSEWTASGAGASKTISLTLRHNCFPQENNDDTLTLNKNRSQIRCLT
jgi:hypothetical protein